MSYLSPHFSILKDHIQKPYKQANYPEEWRNLPEVPKRSEICPRPDELKTQSTEPEDWDEYQKDPIYSSSLPHNIIHGPWPSATDYIGAHYQILREDAIAPLRGAVTEFKRRSDMREGRDFYIYTHVTFRGIQLSRLGPAFRVEFSHERYGKRIRWDQSSRLMQGNLVALSPQSDCFQTICKIAVIAARPLTGGLDQNPPKVDLFWGDSKDLVIDPAERYVMIEARSSYFEASRHMLEAMQKLLTEKFSLANHLVDLDPDVKAPDYVEDHPILDLSSLIPTEKASNPTKDGPTFEESLSNVDVLSEFPNIPESGMDASQMAALKSMLTKKVAIVQGPPGTGKTFVSVAALRVLLANLQPGDPPIVVSAQTNHALDQLLNHVLAFEPNILRLGGRCGKENEAILKRTMYELRTSAKDQGPQQNHGMKAAYQMLDGFRQKIELTLMPLVNQDVISLDTLLSHKIISQAQHDSLEGGSWVGDTPGMGLATWLPGDSLEHLPRTPPIDLELEMEEGDLEQEQLQELENEAATDTRDDRDSDREALKGTWLGFSRTVTGRDTGVEDKEIKKILATHKDLHNIPVAKRGDIYRYWVEKLNRKMKKELKLLMAEYRKAIDNLKLTKWNANVKLIKNLGIKLIGCTTTGLSKYRGLLAAVEPRTILIEEAAETLEGSVIAGMLDSLQHLILVGDHQQLQAGCNVGALEVEPYNMGVSMFERLVNNSIGYIMLNRQRRMIPDIRKLLCIEPAPFYTNLRDHPSVLDRQINRPPIPGMGGRDTYFFHHNWPEARNADSSKYNLDEAQMIAGMFSHLVLNGVPASKITVLTFYNGQRKTIIQELKNHNTLHTISYFNCFTVDSYQGEENDVILLSLVRSNQYLGIGFLDNKNRLVVALSRARRGLYLFGNALTLCSAETSDDILGRDPLWDPLIRHLKHEKRFDLDGGLPITCTRHNRTVSVYEPDNWVALAGGCSLKCGGSLDCGHSCPYTCHPMEHSDLACTKACTKLLPCGHGCSNTCGANCECLECDPITDFPTLSINGYDLVIESDASNLRYSDMRQGFAGVLRGGYATVNSSSGQSSPSKKSPGRGYTTRPTAGVERHVATPHWQGERGTQAWQDWDPQQADAKYQAKLLYESESKPQVDPSKLVFKETYQRTTVDRNGDRVNAGNGRTKRTIREEKSATTTGELREVREVGGYGVENKQVAGAARGEKTPTAAENVSKPKAASRVKGPQKAVVRELRHTGPAVEQPQELIPAVKSAQEIALLGLEPVVALNTAQPSAMRLEDMDMFEQMFFKCE
ncbi:P-loop containing nucleoside triphosphate hydrolase protein [Halenospora varia]|nr:P-loop containing nucleoside triphosphate hydrolase protein [Halenospora varia]